jgi:predicted dehydrogenase
MLKIASVGAGGWASHVHGPALAHYAQQHPGEVELAAVCVRTSLERARQFCRSFGIRRTYTDLEEMLDREKPNACWVVTQISSTRAVVGRVLETGVPCFLEKLSGASLSEAENLAEIARRTGVPNMVALNRRWAPCTRRAIEWLDRVGPVEHFYARMRRPNRMDVAFAFGAGIHLVDCVRLLVEEAAGGVVSARTRRDESAASRGSGDVVYNFQVDLECGSGASARCDILPACGLTDESYTMFGPKAAITVRLPWPSGERETPGITELWVDGWLADSREFPNSPEFLSGGFYRECSEFLSALKEGRRPSPSVEAPVPSVALASAV